jgi:hypothetical protein
VTERLLLCGSSLARVQVQSCNLVILHAIGQSVCSAFLVTSSREDWHGQCI